MAAFSVLPAMSNPWLGRLFPGKVRKHPHKVEMRPIHFSINSSAAGISGRGSNSSLGTRGSNYTDRKVVLESCLVFPPAPATRGKKPRAIIKFLGGAFIGAIPHISYSYFLQLLAKEGFLVISVPYNVSFDHEQASKEVYEKFNSCFDKLLSSGLPDANLSPSHLLDVPLYSVGHSNGALLQVLAGSYFAEKIPKANVMISFNNRPASEAVPYFEQMGPLINQMMPFLEGIPLLSEAQRVSGNAWEIFLERAGAIIPESNQELLDSFTQFVDQLPSVFNQVTQGISEFRPTPFENRNFCQCSYNIEHNLLVKFNFDTIDETDLLEETLKPRVESMGGTLEKVLLTGTHITPCIQEPHWQPGYVYTPADAVAQGLKTISLTEIRVLARTLSDWFRRFEN